MTTRKIVTTAILFVLLTAGITCPQGKTVGTITQTENISPDGKQNYSAQNKPILNELNAELKKARTTGDLNKAAEIQKEINSNDGSYTMHTVPVTDISHPDDISQGDNLNFSIIHPTHAIGSIALSTDKVTGVIYAGYTRYLSSACDEVYIYRSTTNGLSWSFFYSFSVPAYTNLDYEPDQFDMEVVNKGDSTYVFGVLSAYNGNGAYPSFFFRVRQDGLMFNLISFDDVTNNISRFRFPRITSDNARYTLGPYIYISCTLDSLVGTRKYLKSKIAVIANPFAVLPQITIKSNGAGGSYFYYTASSQHDSAFMQSDICFMNVPGDTDAFVTTSVVRGTDAFNGTSLYFTTSPNFGTTVSASFMMNDTKLFESPRIASPGYLTRNVIVGVRRLFAGGDWDPMIYKSTNLTRAGGSFSTNANLNPTTDTTLSIDLAARYGSQDHYMMTYSNRHGDISVGGAAVHRGGLLSYYSFTPSGWGVTSEFGAPVAGFRFVNNDSCLVGWANQNTFGFNVTGGCGGTMTGTGNNNSVADGYALIQNYPNPFNPATKISFSVKQSSFVKLTVYDGLGREITKLVNEITAAGRHEVEFNAAELPSGVYYYKLEAEGFNDVKKMMLIK